MKSFAFAHFWNTYNCFLMVVNSNVNEDKYLLSTKLLTTELKIFLYR